MKLRSKYGVDEVVADGKSYPVVDGVVDVPDKLGASLLEQVDGWAPVKADKSNEVKG